MIISGPTLDFDINSDSFFKNVPIQDIVRYLKGVYTNRERFINNFIDYYKVAFKMHDLDYKIDNLSQLVYYYDRLTPFSYKEAFQLTNAEFKAKVFGSINVPEMIANLGHERVKVEGKNLTLRQYKEDGSYTMVNNDVIYELHEINCTALGVTEKTYAVKCWCTTTNKEHWLWVETEYAKKGPLEAIASTMRVYENMIPHIKTIKRQGDVLLFEMDKDIVPSGKIVPLTADQYFSLLVAQS